MDSSYKQPININIAKNDDGNTCNTYNEFKDYIIINNVNLQKELKESVINIKKLEQELLSKEEIEDKYDTRIRYMKGLLQNLNELRNDYSNIAVKTDSQMTIIKDHYKNVVKKNYFEIYTILIVCNLLTLITPFKLEYFNKFNLILQLFYIIFVIYSFKKIKNNYYTIISTSKTGANLIKDIKTEINSIKLNIKKTEQSCISLDSWINEV